jgi:hypothetical protein
MHPRQALRGPMVLIVDKILLPRCAKGHHARTMWDSGCGMPGVTRTVTYNEFVERAAATHRDYAPAHVQGTLNQGAVAHEHAPESHQET